MLRIVFMGSPEFAVPTLKALIDCPDTEVCAVVTQPDKPAGRGRQLVAPPVKTCAIEHQIPCYQPEKLKTQEMYDILSAIAPDFFVTIAYGKILRQAFLDIPKIAPLNLHASLLPKYRGAAPVQWAILNGEKQTGVCLMKMDAGMDTGPVYTREIIDIAPDETPATLFDKLSVLSAKILMAHIFDIASGKLQPSPQQGDPSAAPPLDKSMGLLDFNMDAQTLVQRIRGLSGWPNAYTFYNGKRLVIHEASVSSQHTQSEPGHIVGLDENKNMLVACQNGMIAVHSLQLEGKKQATAESFFNGYKPAGTVLKPTQA